MTDEERAKIAAWQIGRLYLYLNPSQRKIYDRYDEGRGRNIKFVVNCSRKIGKSVLGLFIASEVAIQKPNALIAFIAPTIDSVQSYIKQLFLVAFASCPEELRPKMRKTELVFKNGSRILFRGVGKGISDSYHNLRSFAFDLIVLDEAGFSSNLDEIVDGALLSTLLPRNGNMLLLSTPPVTPDHAFKEYCDQAKIDGAYVELTIRDSHYTLEQQDKFIKAVGGVDSAKAQREFFCKFIIDTDFQLCPEWKPEYEREIEPGKNWRYFHKYLALDQGWTDNSVCLFGYVNSQTGQLVVLDEVSMKSPEQTTDLLAERIIAKEKDTFNGAEVKRRIADNNTPSLLQDFNLRHKLYFYPVESKTYLDVMVSDVRELVKDGRVLVSPKCAQLLGCLHNGVWTKTKSGHRGKEFARSKTFGHYDGFAALMYLIRSIDLSADPLPPSFERKEEDHFVPARVIAETKNAKGEIIAAGLDDAMAQTFNAQIHDSESYD